MFNTFKFQNYTFGSAISEMQFKSDTGGGYRYGFNTQEKDDEIAGEGNSYTAEFWQYDGRLGRRFNLDPVDQVWMSNYSVLENNPLYFIDPNGDWAKTKVTRYRENGEKKKWWQVWYHTSRYIKTVEVHDVKIINKTGIKQTDANYNNEIESLKNNFRIGIESWNGKSSKNGKKTFIIETKVMGEIEVVEPDNINTIKKGGRHTPDFHYVYNDANFKLAFPGSTLTSQTTGGTMHLLYSQVKESSRNVGKQNTWYPERVIAHEWGHRGGILLHRDVNTIVTSATATIMYRQSFAPNYKEIRKIFRTLIKT
jgi:hypothetical protein